MYVDLEESLGIFQVIMVILKMKGRKFFFFLINFRFWWVFFVFKLCWNGKKLSVEKFQKLKFVGKLFFLEVWLVYEILEIVFSVLKLIKFSLVFYLDLCLLKFLLLFLDIFNRLYVCVYVDDQMVKCVFLRIF